MVLSRFESELIGAQFVFLSRFLRGRSRDLRFVVSERKKSGFGPEMDRKITVFYCEMCLDVMGKRGEFYFEGLSAV